MSEKVCRDCPLYTSRGLSSSSRCVQVKSSSQKGITSYQKFTPIPAAAAIATGTFPQIEVTIPEGIGVEQVESSIRECNALTKTMGFRDKLAYIGRLITSRAREECPAFPEIEVATSHVGPKPAL